MLHFQSAIVVALGLFGAAGSVFRRAEDLERTLRRPTASPYPSALADVIPVKVLRVFNFESGMYWDDFTRKVMKDTLDEKLRILLMLPCACRGAVAHACPVVS